MKKNSSRIPGPSKIQFEESETDQSSSSSSEDVGNLRNFQINSFIKAKFIVRSHCFDDIGGGDRAGAGWGNIWGVAESTLKWVTYDLPKA